MRLPPALDGIDAAALPIGDGIRGAHA